jgi:hypothetical protein
VIAANPPKEMGDWMPLASPTCKIRSNAAGNGLHKERKIKNNPCSKLVPVTTSNWSGNSLHHFCLIVFSQESFTDDV